MKKMLLCSAFLFAALALPAGAQSKKSLRGDIPFEFSVGSYTLPAGSYSIELKENLMWLTNSETGQSMAATLLPTSSANGNTEPAIEFHKYGDKVFLSAVRASDGSHGLPPSKSEREMSKGATLAAVRVGLTSK